VIEGLFVCVYRQICRSVYVRTVLTERGWGVLCVCMDCTGMMG